MEAAKNAVKTFTSNRGHTTDVDEVVNPAVVRETIKPHKHEEIQEAVDREVHQHHYHTTVQPVAHQERLPEKHVHNALPTQHREIRHENDDHAKLRVAEELSQFQNTQHVHETTRTQAAAAAVTGEHVHHHVHETVVPVIHKETIQPEVVHTVRPIHETHIQESHHHGISALPMKTLDEFKKVGGVLEGRKQHSHEEYEGDPRPYNDKLTTTLEKLGFGEHGHHEGTTSSTGSHLGRDVAGTAATAAAGHHSHNTGSGLGREREAGLGGAGAGLGREREAGLGGTGSSQPFTNTRTGGTTAAETGRIGGGGLTGHKDHGVGHRPTDSGVDMNDNYNRSGSGLTGSNHRDSDNVQRSSGGGILNKMNPLTDSDHDGKRGFRE